MPRRKNDLGAGANAQMRAMMARGAPAQQITAALAASGVQGASHATVTRRMREMRKGVNAGVAARAKRPPAPAPVSPLPAPEPEPIVEPSPPPEDDGPPATAKDKQVDELLARSLTWRRVQSALAAALAPHPVAAAAVVRALKAINL